MKRLFQFICLTLLTAISQTSFSQRVVVFSASGGPQLVSPNGNTLIHAFDVLTMESIVNIPYDASLELVDEANRRRYIINTPGRDKLSALTSNGKNSVVELTQRYLQYMQNQLKGGESMAARRHSDPATVTREQQTYQQEDEWASEFEEFTRQATEEYEDFRSAANKEYVEFMEEAWKRFGRQPAIPEPPREEVRPLTLPEKERGKPIQSRPIDIEEFVMPILEVPQPCPIEPVIPTIPGEVVVVDPQLPTVPIVIKEPTISLAPIELLKIDSVRQRQPVGREILFYGTKVYVRFDDEARFSIGSLTEKNINTAWRNLTDDIYRNTIADCLKIREQLRLSDWAYLLLLDKVGETCMGGKTDEAVLLASFIYCQSGYKVRLGFTTNRLCLLFACRHLIYNMTYFDIDGEYFYDLHQGEGEVMICNLPFPNEQSLSLLLANEPILSDNRSAPRHLSSLNQPNLQAQVSVNKNLLDFYTNYPASEIGGNLMTRWAMYANTPLDVQIKELLYPSLNQQMEGIGQKEAVGKILDFVQWSFVYKYDEDVWGYDRAFFAEETLYYPYADCEDRSILFSRLVRDLLGLKVVLVYYPGHLATAVHFTENVEGDYLILDGERYIICDATYSGAPVGKTMPDMDNQSVKAILLQ